MSARRILNAATFAAWSAALAGCVPSCQPRTEGRPRAYEVVGRLTFVDGRSCASAVDSQQIDWPDCHAFKERLDPVSGADYREDRHLAGALRPLPASVALALLSRAPGEEQWQTCAVQIFQTPASGYFRLQLTSGSQCGPVGSALRVVGAATLHYTFTGDAGQRGSVIAVWKRDEAEALLEQNSDQSVQPPEALGSATYATPSFRFSVDLADPHDGTELTRPRRLDVGRQVFAGSAATDAFDYIKQLLSAWATVLKLHRELRPIVGDAEYFAKSFGDVTVDGQTLSAHYGIHFNETWAYGWGTGMALFRPDAERFLAEGDAWSAARLLSNTDVLAHEFGHSIHGAYAGASMRKDYSFANLLRRSAIGGPPGCVSGGADGAVACRDGSVYDWGHGTDQYQEMGVAFVEGIASALGQYLLNRCASWDRGMRPVGGADPFALNPWLRDLSCDGVDGCSYHHIRHHLALRGLDESSDEWAERAGRLLWLTFQAVQAKHRFVLANNEGRWSELGCDLLDDDSDVRHAEGIVNGTNRAYVADYTERVGRVLNGEDPLGFTNLVRWYPAGPVPPDYVRLSLPQLLEAMASFCSACSNLPQQAASTRYPPVRLSTTDASAAVSPHRLLYYLADPARKLIEPSDVSALLRSNFIEDVAYGAPD